MQKNEKVIKHEGDCDSTNNDNTVENAMGNTIIFKKNKGDFDTNCRRIPVNSTQELGN